MNDTQILHDAGHSLGLWLFSDTNRWFEFVLHTVLLVAPLALVLIFGNWGFRLFRHCRGLYRVRAARKRRVTALGTQAVGVFGYIFRHTRRNQFLLLAKALLALPFLYAGLELPKLIINNAISSGHFPIEIADLSLSQTGFLFLLSGLYLVVILVNGTLKYAINVHKGRVAEFLLQRLRLTIYRHWRRSSGARNRTEVIPIVVQEVEPIGGFAGDAFVLPLFQGGTFLTILAFMLVQDPVLGAAAITLLPVQLALIPRLQRKINDLARRRAKEMRGLGGAIGREAADDELDAGAVRCQVAGTLRRVAAIRFAIYRKKFFMKGLNNFITQLTPFFFFTVGGYLVIEDRLSFGALVAVLSAHKDFSAPLKELLKYYQTLEDVRVRFGDIHSFLCARSSHSLGRRRPTRSPRLKGRLPAADPSAWSAAGGPMSMVKEGSTARPCALQNTA